MKLPIVDIKGKKQEEKELKLKKSTADNMDHVLYLVNKHQRAGFRQGSASTKTRSTVTGGGAKPYKQKGTGRARRGSNRTPLRRGGAVTFGPHPRDYSFKINAKTIRAAIRDMIETKKKQIQILQVADNAEIKTKEMAIFLNKDLKNSNDKVTVILKPEDVTVYMACRNIKNVKIMEPTLLIFDQLMDSAKIVITPSALEKLEGLITK